MTKGAEGDRTQPEGLELTGPLLDWIDRMVSGCLVVGVDGRVRHVNQAAAVLLGVEAGALVGSRLDAIFPSLAAEGPEDGAPPPAAYEGRGTLVVEQAGGDETRGRFELRLEPARDGLLVQIVGRAEPDPPVATDVALPASYRAAFDQASIGRALTTPDGRFNRVNRALCDMLGYSAEELAGKTFTELTHPDDLEASRQCAEGLLSGRMQHHRFEKRYLRSDGSAVSALVSATVVRGTDGAPIHFVTDIVDLSAQRTAEAALSAEQQRAQLYLDVVGVMVVALDAEGRITLVNRMACELLGRTPEELVGQHWFDLCIPEEARERVRSAFRRVLQEPGGALSRYDNEIVTASGERRLIEWTNTPLCDDTGRRLGTLSSGQDVTERRLREQKLREAEEQFRTTLYSIGDAVITTDPAGLVSVLNPVAEQLTGWTERDARGKHLSAVFRILNETTREPVESPVERALREGRVVGLANHTILVSRSGTERPIADSGAPIRGQDGETTGVVLVFRDQTRARLLAKMAQARLAIAEYAASHSLRETLQRALDEVGALVSSPIGFYHFVEADGRTLALQQWSSRTLDEFCKAEGEGLHYDVDRAGVWVDCVRTHEPVVHNDYPSLPHRKGLPEGHAPITRELVVPVLSEGRIVAILGVGNKPTDYDEVDVEIVGHLAEMTWYLVEQKRIEQTLRDREAHLAAIYDNVPMVMLLLDEDRRILEANGFARQFTGRDHSELKGMQGGEALRCVHALDSPEGCGFGPSCQSCVVRATVLDTLATGRPHQNVEATLPVTREGTTLEPTFLLSATPVTIATRRRVLVTILDITERKLAREKLARNEARQRSLVEIAELGTSNKQETISFALRRGLELTSSEIGYVFAYDEDAERFTLLTRSSMGRDGCGIADPASTYELATTGLWGEVVRQRRPIVDNEYASPGPLKRGLPDGHVSLERFLSVPVVDGGRIVAVVGVANKASDYDEDDVAQLSLLFGSAWRIIARMEAEKALVESEARARTLYERLPLPSFLWRRAGDDFVLSDVNEAGIEVTGGRVRDWLGRPLSELYADEPSIVADIRRCFDEQISFRREMRYRYRTTGKGRTLATSYVFVPSDMILVHTEDVTAQRKAEEQTAVSQRLEAIGQLAGGVAHDFNNLLTVINTFSSFALEALRESDPVRDDVMQIHEAGKRAAGLTRQLLAFSRRQVLEPTVVSLNDVVASLEPMLRRLLAEDIETSVRLAEDLGNVVADPGQIEQVIVNLAVNARDAMPDGGKLLIETRNVLLDEEYAASHADVEAGEHAALIVSDTGCGMDETTRRRIFEPFFTTKEKGRGTGLGLATVYGIVRQSGGHISVYSELGSGTTFRIYLRTVAEAVGPEPRELTAESLTGDETVLVVEDEDAVRALAVRILRNAGYTVLAAANGGEALLLCEERGEEVDLLLTDVVMPKMGGKQLAERLAALCPRIKVLYTSGYTDNAIVHHGVLDPGTHFIAKPFTAADLERKVRAVLDERT